MRIIDLAIATMVYAVRPGWLRELTICSRDRHLRSVPRQDMESRADRLKSLRDDISRTQNLIGIDLTAAGSGMAVIPPRGLC